MRLYTVQHRPGQRDARDAIGAADPDVVLIKEGFCWPALFLPLPWLLYRMQFWGLLAYLLLTGALSAVAALTGMDPLSGMLLSLVLSLLVASVANEWRRWRLAARGYEFVTIVAANNPSEAEEKFFHHVWRRGEAENPGPAQSLAPLPASGLSPFATPFDPI
mgnify:CR=1 FL=1